MFVMLNPSTADADVDDPTIRRCIGYAKAWGCGGLWVGNLFAFRATNPRGLLEVEDPVGPHNDDYLLGMAYRSDLVVAAWGANAGRPQLMGRAEHVTDFLTSRGKALCVLRWLKCKQPSHPLYLPKGLQPQRWKPPGFVPDPHFGEALWPPLFVGGDGS
jgi:hypothetical protein